ncbi:2-hydroxyacyl-CoA dehydratase family protein [Fusobacterium simiae]|uniref:2-hydroxyacyl-CoA dehydratase subunit D n=1 Tax=Fusobacterium simiae TaxID=855 RepID=UPI0020C36429|nr:2-hydroxyacyl-CoA dehydratase family protein [Fusobacterium simiae]MDC7955236.1 2-hydroxyacyl-CoA dehydratase family protein [Fusobacterium simiae]
MKERLEELIHIFEEIANNPKKMVEDYKKETGKEVIGVMPVYTPEEIIHAAGCLPIGLWGGKKEISKARAYLPPFACSIMQTVMELEIEGTYDILDAVLFSVPCDTLKCLSQKWKGKSPVIIFTHPQNRVIEGANIYLKREYETVKEELEKILGRNITNENLKESIKIYNENRKTMREFVEIAAQYPQIIDPIIRHNIIKSRWFIRKEKHTAYVKELINELKKEPIIPWDGKKVILTGIMAEPKELLEIFKDEKIAIVGDDLAQESRQFRGDIPEDGEDVLYNMTKWWQNLEGCSLATDTNKVRGEMLINMCKSAKADAVIVCMMKFCDPEEFDYPIYHREFSEAEIKNISIEVDLEVSSFEQIRTRLQTFKDIL